MQNAVPQPADTPSLERFEEIGRANEFLYQTLELGQYMLQCGGEVSRVEDSIRRICLSFGAERADVFTITSSIVVTIYAQRFGAVTQTRRVTGMQYDLHRLELLNTLSRRVCAEHLTAPEMARALFVGGSAMDAVASGIIGVGLKFLDRFIRAADANAFLSALLCSLLGGLLAGLAVTVGLGDSVDMISIGNIMLLIPGIAMTNSLRDMFSGNTISGMMRFIEALLQAMVIAFGFALAGALF